MRKTACRVDQRRRRDRETGAVLLTVLLVMIALLGLGITSLWLTSGNLQMSGNTNLRNQALYLAEMAIEVARHDLNQATPPNKVLLLTGPSLPQYDNPPCVANVLIQDTVTELVTRPGVIYCLFSDCTNAANHLVNKKYPPVDRTDGSNPTMGTYSVWVRNDTAELKLGCTPYATQDSNNTLVLHAKGVAADGRTTVVLEATMGPGSTPTGPTPPGAGNAPVLCNSGRNACDENSSVQAGVVAQ